MSLLLQVLLQPSLLLVWGGSNLQPAYADAALFNATNLSWSSAAPLLQARSWSGFASCGNARACAIGGMSLVPFFDPMSAVEMCESPLLHSKQALNPPPTPLLQLFSRIEILVLPAFLAVASGFRSLRRMPGHTVAPPLMQHFSTAPLMQHFSTVLCDAASAATRWHRPLKYFL
jgi:hypothetical protein